MILSEIEAAGWVALQQAAADPHAGFRTVTLCSVDAAAAPQARMVVLRACDPARRTLEIHMQQNQIADDRSFGWEGLLLGK